MITKLYMGTLSDMYPTPPYLYLCSVAVRNSALEEIIGEEDRQEISGKTVVVADVDKQEGSNVADINECKDKCAAADWCVALSATTNWKVNRCVLFREVTRLENSAAYASIVKLCTYAGFQVPCYLKLQEDDMLVWIYDLVKICSILLLVK